jgi:uncharacterized protein YoxC
MAFFKKKAPEVPPEFPEQALPQLPPLPELPPISPDITQPQIRDLTTKGYPSTDVLAGMQAAPLRPAPAPMPTTPQLPPIPTPPVFRPAPAPAPAVKTTTEEIEEVAEAIISEKWQKFDKELDELKKSQEELSSAISGMQERITNVEKKIDMVIQEILGKVEEYGKGISDVGTELKAMQRVFNTIMPTFTENIKELQELVGAAKEKGFKKKAK